jgi:hypothetical protein
LGADADWQFDLFVVDRRSRFLTPPTDGMPVGFKNQNRPLGVSPGDVVLPYRFSDDDAVVLRKGP